MGKKNIPVRSHVKGNGIVVSGHLRKIEKTESTDSSGNKPPRESLQKIDSESLGMFRTVSGIKIPLLG